jgi:hypothetical protein
VITTICLLFSCGFAAAQADSKKDVNTTIGRSAPEEKGQLQPQGWTGPVDTKSGGAPPESPQGQSPPGMQAAPEGFNENSRRAAEVIPARAVRVRLASERADP